jgi:hypothetical protein
VQRDTRRYRVQWLCCWASCQFSACSVAFTSSDEHTASSGVAPSSTPGDFARDGERTPSGGGERGGERSSGDRGQDGGREPPREETRDPLCTRESCVRFELGMEPLTGCAPHCPPVRARRVLGWRCRGLGMGSTGAIPARPGSSGQCSPAYLYRGPRPTCCLGTDLEPEVPRYGFKPAPSTTRVRGGRSGARGGLHLTLQPDPLRRHHRHGRQPPSDLVYVHVLVPTDMYNCYVCPQRNSHHSVAFAERLDQHGSVAGHGSRDRLLAME